ncbi:MAG: hypothetical protein IJ272_05455 [Clostridia bacterium]|nr:hypothetical protein [Clostridia bacterium]
MVEKAREKVNKFLNIKNTILIEKSDKKMYSYMENKNRMQGTNKKQLINNI